MSLGFLFALTSCPMSTPGNSSFLLTTPASQLLQGTELRASGPGVDIYFSVSRYYGLSCHEPCLGRPVAYAFRDPRRADAACRGAPEGVLHYPVFERVEGYDDKPSARLERFYAVREGVLQAPELVVYRYPQGLEDACGGVDLPVPRLRRDCPLDYLRKLCSRLDRLCGTGLYDRPRDPL